MYTNDIAEPMSGKAEVELRQLTPAISNHPETAQHIVLQASIHWRVRAGIKCGGASPGKIAVRVYSRAFR